MTRDIKLGRKMDTIVGRKGRPCTCGQTSNTDGTCDGSHNTTSDK